MVTGRTFWEEMIPAAPKLRFIEMNLLDFFPQPLRDQWLVEVFPLLHQLPVVCMRIIVSSCRAVFEDEPEPSEPEFSSDETVERTWPTLITKAIPSLHYLAFATKDYKPESDWMYTHSCREREILHGGTSQDLSGD
ncbi:hypothetical protein A0H81_07436 [Grifola frondosa]|uniref:Uncharacterized protein n=1 Tax=Grifola frondosa TaxID=5627 RepID=A0A1C7M6N9_GRIFR|nr:hypothetical protein A0H81_07436 [Grifola frondosa]